MLVCLPVEFRFTYSNFRFVKIVRCWSWCTRWWWWRIDGRNETVKWQSKVWLSLAARSHLRHIPAWPLQKLNTGFRDSLAFGAPQSPHMKSHGFITHTVFQWVGYIHAKPLPHQLSKSCRDSSRHRRGRLQTSHLFRRWPACWLAQLFD